MLKKISEEILAGKETSQKEIEYLIEIPDQEIMNLLAAANRIKNEFIGQKVDLCAIVNAKSGTCSEDCTFCAQSAHYDTKAVSYQLLPQEEILNRAKKMEKEGAQHFGIVSSGRGVVDDEDFEKLLEAMQEIKKETKLEVCASLGTVDRARARQLAEVGLKRYNHNLETAASYFSEVCTTHTYQERVTTVRNLKEVGIEVCCGGIIGLGESMAQRVELAFTLKELDVDSVPLNILNPVPGTPLEDIEPLAPLEVLKTAAIFRFILPQKVIKLCGGREDNLRDLQSLSLLAGVNGLLIGDYLTTTGREASQDLQMINDLGLIGGRN